MGNLRASVEVAFERCVVEPLRRRAFLYLLERLARSRVLARELDGQLEVFVEDADLRAQLESMSLRGVTFPAANSQRRAIENSRSGLPRGNTRARAVRAASFQSLKSVPRPLRVEPRNSTAGVVGLGAGMRIRTVKPEFWSHRKLKHESPGVQLLALGLISMADDEGYLWAGVDDVRDAVRPGERVLPRVARDLKRLVALNYIVICETKEGPLGYLPTFLDHQRINRPHESRLKKHWPENSVNAHGARTDRSPLEGKGSGKGKEQGSGIRDAQRETPEENAEEILKPQPRTTSGRHAENPGVAGWYKFQAKRKALGLSVERSLDTKPESLDELWSKWLALREKSDAGDESETRLWAAVDLFFTDDYWRKKEFPWAAWMKQAGDKINELKASGR